MIVKCGSCQKKLKAHEKLAGKKVKCPGCGAVLKIPQPGSTATAASSAASSAASQREDIPLQEPKESTCPSCRKPLSPSAVLCVDCGYDLRSGRKLQTEIDSEESAPASFSPRSWEKSSADVHASSQANGPFWRGCVLSAIAVLITAAVWCGVAVFTGREFGLIAWALGIMAGGGMVLGYGGDNDLAGITAAFIALFGIVAAKWMIFSSVVLPILNEITQVLGETMAEAAPSTAGLFFSSMFGPMDGIFILLAFFTAYKFGTGKGGDD